MLKIRRKHSLKVFRERILDRRQRTEEKMLKVDRNNPIYSWGEVQTVTSSEAKNHVSLTVGLQW